MNQMVKGKSVSKYPKKAIYKYIIAAELGDAKAQFSLGLCYYKGIGLEKDGGKAIDWWVKAAAQGHAKAQANLDYCLENGWGVPKDMKKTNRTISVSMKNAGKSFGKNEVLKNVSFETYAGEIFGMLGPSGAGKTTIINILTRQLTADSGECHVSAGGNEIGLMLEDDGLFSRLSCLDNLIVFEDIYRIPRKRTLEALEKVGLGKAINIPAEQLSKGMRQRLVLARAVLHKPKILFLDEPTSALDPMTARGIHKLIRNLRASGSTVFLTTHNMEEATHLCDRVVMLHKGRIIEEGSPRDICRRYNASKNVLDLESVFVKLTGKGLE